MATPVTFNPMLTRAGQAAAINANATGVQLALTEVAFGTGIYDPNGNETALQNEVKRVSIISGSMVTPYQARITSVWGDDEDDYPINEVGFFAGPVLVAVWSRSTGGPLGYKTPGIDFVLFNDIRFVGVPADSIVIQVDDSGGGAALAALGAHEAATDPHSGYVRKALFPDAHAFRWCEVDLSGSANAIKLFAPDGVTVSSYKRGQQFTFKAAASNTNTSGEVTVSIAGLAATAIKKGGGANLVANDIQAGGVYHLSYDGTSFHVCSGVIGDAMALHEAATDPHNGYVRKALFPDATEYLWCSVGGTQNAITLTPAGGVTLAAYGSGGKRFVFKASAANTGAVTVNINGLGVKSVKKNGNNDLAIGDIQAGGIYELIYDGAKFQIMGGVGGGALQTFNTYEFTAVAGQTTFSFPYKPGSVVMFRNGARVGFSGSNGSSVSLLSPATVGDLVVALAFNEFNLANAYTKPQARMRMYYYGQI